MVKRRERRVGGCEKSIIEECIWSKRGMERAIEFWWFRRSPSLFASANSHFVISDSCDGDNESV